MYRFVGTRKILSIIIDFNNYHCSLPETQGMLWVNKYGWSVSQDDTVYIANQEDNIKTKNITEKITFESKLVFRLYWGFLKK